MYVGLISPLSIHLDSVKKFIHVSLIILQYYWNLLYEIAFLIFIRICFWRKET